jgi:DNA repair exonuclease SbcCD nuclease subunit
MIRLLHIADVHLGASFSGFADAAEARRASVIAAFRGLSEVVVSEGVDAVAIAGDLFDTTRPAVDVLAAARETVRRLHEAGAPVFVVPGNHDTVTLHPNPYSEPLGPAHVFTAPAFEAPVSVETASGPLHVYGVAYDPTKHADPLATFVRSAGPGAHVVLLHGSVPGAPHWDLSPNAMRLPLEALAGLRADYVALGDHHRFRPPERLGPDLRACYCGSFAALDLTETGPRGYVIADVEADLPPVVRHCPAAVAHVEELAELDVGECRSEAAVADAIAGRAPADVIPLVTLTGAPPFPLAVEEVETHLRARFPHARVIDRSSYFGSRRLDELAEEDTIVGHVVRLGRRRVETAGDERSRAVAERSLRIALRSLEVR